MDNGGYNNIEKLHMKEDDTRRHKKECSFFIEGNFYNQTKDRCNLTKEECKSSMHCQNYTTSADKAIDLYDKYKGSKNSRNCTYIDISLNIPICTKSFPQIMCEGLNGNNCPRKQNNNYIKSDPKYENNKNIFNYYDEAILERYENDTHIIFKISGIHFIKNDLKTVIENELIKQLIGKKIGDTITHDNKTWRIINIIKSNKKNPVVLIKKKDKSNTTECKYNSAKKNTDTVFCKYCKKKIPTRQYYKHILKERQKRLLEHKDTD